MIPPAPASQEREGRTVRKDSLLTQIRTWSASAVSSPSVKALLGLIALLGLLALGILVRTAEVTEHDLHVDLLIQPLRSSGATAVFLALTSSASEIVGIGALATGLLALLVRRRRWDAFRLAAMAGSSWVLAILVKHVVGRPRPPASLWAIRPDASGSFPSGHDTTACVLVLVVLMTLHGAHRLRVWGTLTALAFAVGVGLSRVYLGDHYPTDVLGSWLTVAAAALLVWAATDLPVVRRVAGLVLRDSRATRVTPRRSDRKAPPEPIERQSPCRRAESPSRIA